MEIGIVGVQICPGILHSKGESLNEFVAMLDRVVDAMFNEHGEIRSFFYGVTDDHVGFFFQGAVVEDKDLMCEMARDIFEMVDAVRYAFIDETWVVKGRTREEMAGVTPRDHPSREEYVMVMAENHDRNVVMWLHQIIRTPNEKPRLGPPDVSVVPFDSRFCGLLPRYSEKSKQ